MMSRAVARAGRGAVVSDLGRSGGSGGSVWYHRGLLREFGFVERVRGSHHMFRKGGVEERINQAMDLWIDTAREFGDPIPEPKGERLMLA